MHPDTLQAHPAGRFMVTITLLEAESLRALLRAAPAIDRPLAGRAYAETVEVAWSRSSLSYALLWRGV